VDIDRIGVAFVVLAIVIPWLIVRMPEDFFAKPQRYSWLDGKAGMVRIPLCVLKNVLAFALIAVGVVMFLTPSFGLFPILLGVALADFPGKERLQRWILCRQTVRGSMNWLRGKFHRKPVEIPSRTLAA
jgi:hypothetical protein